MITLEKNNKIELAQNKSKEFNIILKKTLSKIKYNTKYYYPFSKEDREELLQNTLTQAYLSYPTFDESKGTFMGWISYIMRNQMIDEYRKNNKRNALTDSMDQENDYGHSSYSICGNDFERLEKNIEIQEIYAQKIKLLSSLHQEIFKMLIEGYSLKEIGNVVGLTKSVVKARIFRIRTFIRH